MAVLVESSHYEKYGRAWYNKNKEAELHRAKERYKKVGMSEKKRKHYMYYRYGITEEDYNNLFNGQEGVCKICKTPPKEGRRLDIDHCHETKKVRGLLCNNCNRGLGHFMDNHELLQKAINYLENDVMTNKGGSCGV